MEIMINEAESLKLQMLDAVFKPWDNQTFFTDLSPFKHQARLINFLYEQKDWESS